MANKNNNIVDTELSPFSLEQLGIKKQPFANEILTGKNFFEHQSLTKITESVMHQVQFSDLLLLVEGDHGAGKTALFRQFIQLEITNTKVLSIQAEATDTLEQIQEKMSLHLQDLGDASHLDENLKNLQTFDQIPLICMDNSHVLSDSTLQELLRYRQQLKLEHEVSLKILFFANTGLAETLQKISDLQADHMYVQNIPGLSPKQAENFIMHRLRCVGYSGEPQINSDELDAITSNKNTPLNVMTQAAILINKKILAASKPKSNLIKISLIALLTICVIATGAYFAFDLLNKEKLKKSNLIEQKTQSRIDKLEAITADTLIEEAAQEDIDVIDILKSDETISNEEKTEATLDNLQQPTDQNTKQNIEQNNLVPDAEQTKSIITVTNEVDENTITPEPKEDIAVEKKPEPVKNKAPQLSPTLLQLNKMGLHDANWLKQQSKQNWSLQLLGARDPQTLLKFSQRHSLSDNTAWYKTWLKEKPYYVLVHGSYISRDAARNAIANLSPALQKLKPWVKSMKSIQKALPVNTTTMD